MFRFENPEFFSLLLVLPVLAFLYLSFRWWRTRRWQRFATQDASERLQGTRSARREWIRVGLIFVSLLCIVIAFINPQWGYRKEKIKAATADIYLALDISNSMLAEDVAPSRLERAKHLASQIVESFRSERIGLILFAGNAYLQTPLTTDFAAVQMFVRAAHPGQAATQGTAFSDVVDLVRKAHREEKTSKVALVMLTDGENHEQGAIEAIQEGREEGIVPVVIAVGTEQGTTIPLTRNGRVDVKRDRQGNPVTTRLNPKFLQQLAQAGGGELLTYNQGDEIIQSIRSKIDELGKLEMEARSFTDYRSFYPYFLALALICLVLEQMLGERSSKQKLTSVFQWK